MPKGRFQRGEISKRERIREGSLTRDIREFSNIIDQLELNDLPLKGEVFTWKGQGRASLDRCLIMDDLDTTLRRSNR